MQRIWQSSLGRKYVMALTGAALFVFVVGHLVGNLQVFGPPELINSYAHFLKSKPGLLWGARLGLLACVGLHIAAAVSLSAMNKAARPEGYAGGTAYGSTVNSRSMMVSGLVILAFVLYHLAHFTALLPGVNGVGDFSRLKTILRGETVLDVYAMMVLGFQVWWVVLFYLVAQGLLFMHLGHGVASLFQSLGFRNHVWWPRITAFAKVASVAIFVGYAVIPVAIFLRVVGADYAEKRKHDLVAAPLPTARASGERTRPRVPWSAPSPTTSGIRDSNSAEVGTKADSTGEGAGRGTRGRVRSQRVTGVFPPNSPLWTVKNLRTPGRGLTFAATGGEGIPRKGPVTWPR